MEFKGTQSQWTRKGNQVMSAENKTIADCRNELMLMSETNANAKLIAHAPELLDTIQELFEILHKGQDDINTDYLHGKLANLLYRICS
jgi:hypothetical protein